MLEKTEIIQSRFKMHKCPFRLVKSMLPRIANDPFLLLKLPLYQRNNYYIHRKKSE